MPLPDKLKCKLQMPEKLNLTQIANAISDADWDRWTLDDLSTILQLVGE